MKLGIGVLTQGQTAESLTDYIGKLREADVKAVHVRMDWDTWPGIYSLLAGMDLYVSLAEIGFDFDLKQIEAKYRKFMGIFPEESLAVSLPRGIWNMVNTKPRPTVSDQAAKNLRSKTADDWGLEVPENPQLRVRKTEVVKTLNIITKIIKDRGHKVAMPMQADDVESGVWDEVDFDIYDVNGRIQGPVDKFFELLPAKNKPIWVVDACRVEGPTSPDWIRYLHQNRQAEYVFLCSDPTALRNRWFLGDEPQSIKKYFLRYS